MKQWQIAVPYVLQTIAWLPALFILKFFIRLHITGRNNVKEAAKLAKGRGIIFAVNHVSEWDPIIATLGIYPFSKLFPMFYVAHPDDDFRSWKEFGWRSLFYGGRFFQAWGSYPIIRGQKDYAVALKNHLPILKAGRSLVMFPEGGMTKDGRLQPGRGGIGYLAHESGAVILPVAISGIFGLSVKGFLLRRNQVRVSIGEPIERPTLFSTDVSSIEEYQAASQKIIEAIRENLVVIKNKEKEFQIPEPFAVGSQKYGIFSKDK